MTKLFLSSADIKPETQEAFLKLIGKNPKDCKLAFIPTAADVEENKEFVQWTIDQIKELGIDLYEVDLKGENEQSLYDKLSVADIICVNGGNTFYLLEKVYESGFDKAIKRLLDEGKVYFGVSAGSYIMCPTIEAAKWKHLDDPNKAKATALEALGYVDFLIIAHYSEKHEQNVINGAKTTDLPVIAITDQQAIVVEDEKVLIAGPKEVLKFNGFEVI